MSAVIAQSHEITGFLEMIQAKNMAHRLNYKVVAEGVEYEDELALLKKLGCDIIQGYLFSPAVESSKTLDLVTLQRKD